MTVSKIFKQQNMQMGNASVEYLIFVVKSVNFDNEGTFTRISSMQDERDILKWNDSAKPWYIYRI